MGTRCSTLRAATAVLCGAVLTLAACGSGAGDSASSQFCKDNSALGAKVGSLYGLGPGNPDAAAKFAEAATVTKKLADEAPAPVKADVQKVADILRKGPEKGGELFLSDDTQATLQRVGDYVDANCPKKKEGS